MAIYEQGTLLKDMRFEPGDEFVVVGKAAISGIIRYITRGLASHAGIIVDSKGRTIEALSTIKISKLSHYAGQQILIVRPGAPKEKKEEAIKAIIDKWLNKRYPWWRLGVHIIDSILPTFGKINLLGIPVCSEVVTYAEWKMGIRKEDRIWGINPNELADYWLFSSIKFVYRGRLIV